MARTRSRRVAAGDTREPEETPANPGTPGEDLLALVQADEQRALAALTQAAGDASLCALSRAGEPHPAVKFHEGAAAALAAVRRALARNPETDPATALTRTRSTWEERNAAAATRGPDWAAYHAGGVEALERLVEVLER